MPLKWWDWLGDRLLYLAIALGLVAGLLGAVGRERHEGRRPTRDWLTNRLLLMPFLAIVATMLAETVLASLSRAVATFVAAALSLAGYDALARIERKALGRITDAIPINPDANVEGESGTAPAHRPVTQATAGPIGEGRPQASPIAKLRDVVPLEPPPLEQQVLLDKLKDVP